MLSSCKRLSLEDKAFSYYERLGSEEKARFLDALVSNINQVLDSIPPEARAHSTIAGFEEKYRNLLYRLRPENRTPDKAVLANAFIQATLSQAIISYGKQQGILSEDLCRTKPESYLINLIAPRHKLGNTDPLDCLFKLYHRAKRIQTETLCGHIKQKGLEGEARRREQERLELTRALERLLAAPDDRKPPLVATFFPRAPSWWGPLSSAQLAPAPAPKPPAGGAGGPAQH